VEGEGVKLSELRGGDKVAVGADHAVLVVVCQHPVWERARLAVWRMAGDDSVRIMSMSPDDEVGDPEPVEPVARAERLMDATVTGGEVLRFGGGLRPRGEPEP
jgi:hypothetical protein